MRVAFLSALSVLLTAPGFLLVSAAVGHPGGLNAEGCHNNRKTGDYHCHRSAAKGSSGTRSYGVISSGRTFRNCSDARAAGAAPVKVGDAGYGSHLDRDRDGVGCE